MARGEPPLPRRGPSPGPSRFGTATAAGPRGRAATLRADVLGARAAHEVALGSGPGAAGPAEAGWGCAGAAATAPASMAAAAPPTRAASVPDLTARAYAAGASRPPKRSGPAARPCSAGVERPASAGQPLARAAGPEPRDEAALRTPVASYLRLCGLGQYASAFADAGLTCLSTIGRLAEDETLDFLEGLQLYPGHKARLLRALGALRQATVLGGRELCGRSREEPLLEQLCERNDLLAMQQRESEAQGRLLQQENHQLLLEFELQREENHRLLLELERCRGQAAELEALNGAQAAELGRLAEELRQLAAPGLTAAATRGAANAMESAAALEELAQSRHRITELEKLVWTQTEQVKFLAGQVQRLAGAALPEALAATGSTTTGGEEGHSEAAATSSASSGRSGRSASERALAPPGRGIPPPAEESGRSPEEARPPVERFRVQPWACEAEDAGAAAAAAAGAGGRRRRGSGNWSSALGERKDTNAGMNPLDRSSDVETVADLPPMHGTPPPISQFEAVRGPKDRASVEAPAARPPLPHCASALAEAPGGQLEQVALCLAKAVENKLRLGGGPAARGQPAARGASEVFLAPACQGGARAQLLPNKWEICEFLLNVMTSFQLVAQVAVLTLVYLSRFTEHSGITFMAENWHRVTFTAMMIASKVWSEDALTNAEVAKISLLYSKEDVDAFEEVFRQSLGSELAVEETDYANAHFLLQTLGMRETAEIKLPQLGPEEAEQLKLRSFQRRCMDRERHSEWSE